VARVAAGRVTSPFTSSGPGHDERNAPGLRWMPSHSASGGYAKNVGLVSGPRTVTVTRPSCQATTSSERHSAIEK
jgi:hypothetical protein